MTFSDPRRSSGPPIQFGPELLGVVLLLGVSARFLTMFFHRGVNLLDEGSTVAMANRLLHGDVIYRDFLSVATPGSFYTVAWLFQIFGSDVMVVRWIVLALCLGILLSTLIVGRHLMTWPFAAASALLTVFWGWLRVAPNLYSLEAMFFALVALVCHLRYVQRGRTPWLLLAGLAAGASILVKQNTGVLALVALLASVWLSSLVESAAHRRRSHRLRDSVLLIAGATMLVVPVMVYLVRIGAAPHLYENWVYYPLHAYPRGLSVDYPPFYPLTGNPDLTTLSQVLPTLLREEIDQPAGYEIWQKFVLYIPWLVYPLCAAVLGLLALRRASSHEDGDEAENEARLLLPVLALGALTFLQAWPRADVTHILFAMPPAFVLFGYASFWMWRSLVGFLHGTSRLVSPAFAPRYRWFETVLVVICLLPQAALLRNGYKFAEFSSQNDYLPLHLERASGVRTSARNAAQIDQVTNYITSHTQPGQPIFVVPWAAGFYFLTDRPNPTRFDVLLYDDAEQYPCLVTTLDERKPEYVIYGYGWDVDGKRFREYAAPIDAYIRSSYQMAQRFDEFEIWRRKDNTAPVFSAPAGACRRRLFDSQELTELIRGVLK